MDYLGRIPAGGCTSVSDCVDALGGQESDWTCFAGEEASGACVVPDSSNPGTCICGAYAENCPNG